MTDLFYETHIKAARYFNERGELRSAKARDTWGEMTDIHATLFSAIRNNEEAVIEECIGKMYIYLSKLSEQTNNDPIMCFKNEADKLKRI